MTDRDAYAAALARAFVRDAIEKAIAMTPVKNRNEAAAMAHLLTHTAMVDDATEAALTVLAKELRAKATLRFDDHGPYDARGAAIWDCAAWLEQEPCENAPLCSFPKDHRGQCGKRGVVDD